MNENQNKKKRGGDALLKHRRVQDTELPDADGTAAEAEVDGGGAAGEEGGLVDGLEPVAVPLRVVLADDEVLLDLLRGGGGGQAFLARQECHAQHQHHAVEQAVHLLEAARLAVPGRAEVTFVPGLALDGGVLEYCSSGSTNSPLVNLLHLSESLASEGSMTYRGCLPTSDVSKTRIGAL